jgi:hypothetical protein
VPVWLEDTPFAWQDAVLYFAMTDRFKDGDAGNNAPVSNVDPKANWQGGDFAGLKSVIDSGYFDTLTAVRKAHRAFRYGQRTTLYMDSSNGLFWAYGMKDGSDVGVVVFNRNGSSKTQSVNVAGLGLTNGQALRDVIHNTTVTVSGGAINVTLGSRDSAVFVLQ